MFHIYSRNQPFLSIIEPATLMGEHIRCRHPIIDFLSSCAMISALTDSRHKTSRRRYINHYLHVIFCAVSVSAGCVPKTDRSFCRIMECFICTRIKTHAESLAKHLSFISYRWSSLACWHVKKHISP